MKRLYHSAFIIFIDKAKQSPMVIVNYERFLHDTIQEEVADCSDKMLCKALSSSEFEELVIKLYEYCEELNIIKRRVEKLKFVTEKNETIMPKLIDSEITRIDNKAKQIGTAYSLFLLQQRKFKVLSNESKYFEQILKIIVRVAVEKCFNKEDSQHLTKEVNRLFRTNTFNSQNCWKVYIEGLESKKDKFNPAETNFRAFRRSVYSEHSQIKPYVNNKTCFKSLKTRSPIISLWHPNSEFLSFTLARKNHSQKKF